MGDRDPGVGPARDSGGDARHDREPDSGRLQRLRLLAAPAEHERVATLQAHDRASRPTVLDQQAIDLGLGRRLAAPLLADVDELGIGPGAVQRPSGISRS